MPEDTTLPNADAGPVDCKVRWHLRPMKERMERKFSVVRSLLDGKSRADCAAAIGVSPERVRQIDDSIIRKLKHPRYESACRWEGNEHDTRLLIERRAHKAFWLARLEAMKREIDAT